MAKIMTVLFKVTDEVMIQAKRIYNYIKRI